MITPSNPFTLQIVAAAPAPVPASFITAPFGSLVSGANTFTFGPVIAEGGNALLVNGVQHGSGHYLFSVTGIVYTLNVLGSYYQWNGAGWTSVAKPVGAPV